MPLTLNEAETAAYADPSQENLAVYVKLLEGELEGFASLRAQVAKLQEAYDAGTSDKEIAGATYLFLAGAGK